MDFNKDLVQRAVCAQKFAYAPYSNFAVGAALLTADGKVFSGCNIESAAFSATNCAERTALFKAISEGETEFKAIAIVGGTIGEHIKDFCPPCGTCRQVMAEFCDAEKFCVVLFNGSAIKCFTLKDLLPHSFGLI